MPLLPAGIDPIARQLEGWDALAARSRRHSGKRVPHLSRRTSTVWPAKLARALPAGVRMVSVDGRWAQTDLPRTAIGRQTGILVNNARMAGGTRAAGPGPR